MKRTRYKTNGDSAPQTNIGRNGELPGITACKESMFVHEYLTDLDMVGAAIRAGLVSPNDTKKRQREQAEELYYKNSVQTYLHQAVGHRIARTQVTEDRVVNAMKNIAFNDPISLFREDGSMRDINELPKEARMAINKLEYTRHGVKVEFYDKMNALKTLLQHIGRLAPDSGSGLNINYNQFNVTQNNNTQNNITNNHVDLNDFTDEELRVIRKMAGDNDPADIMDLQEIEAGYYD